MACPSCFSNNYRFARYVGDSCVFVCNKCGHRFDDYDEKESHKKMEPEEDDGFMQHPVDEYNAARLAKWDAYFMGIAQHAATLSKDESTKLGAVIVGPDREIRATGYNSFPRGVNDNVQARQERPLKYRWIEHAERNAIYNAARVGVPLKGCTLYCAWPPCTDCARAIIQAGIVEVVVGQITCPEADARWNQDASIAWDMLHEAGVKTRTVY